MEKFNLGIDPSKYLPKKEKIDYSYQALGVEMQEYYPVSVRPRLWGLFFKYQEEKIRDAFLLCKQRFHHTKEQKYREFNYLVGIIKRL